MKRDEFMHFYSKCYCINIHYLFRAANVRKTSKKIFNAMLYSIHNCLELNVLNKWYLHFTWSHMIQTRLKWVLRSGELTRSRSEVVILTGGWWRVVVVGVDWALRAGGGCAAHCPQLSREGPPPAARPTNRPQQTHQLYGLVPIKRSLAVAARITLFTHVGQHLANVRRQQVVHFITLWWRNKQKLLEVCFT